MIDPIDNEPVKKDCYEKEPDNYFCEPCDTCIHRHEKLEKAPCLGCIHYE
jgi:hypothetical protein